MKAKLYAVVAVLAIAAGCAPISPGLPPPTQPSPWPPIEPPAPAPQPGDKIKPVETREETAGNAVAQLLAEAWRLNQGGQYDRSNAVAERALRLNRAEAEIYLVLASNYFAMAQLQLAEQLARQGLPLAGNNRTVELDLKRVLNQIMTAGR